MVALIIVILSERNLVIANAIEAPGVLARSNASSGAWWALPVFWQRNWLVRGLKPFYSKCRKPAKFINSFPVWRLILGTFDWLSIADLGRVGFRKVLFGNLVNVTGIFGGALIASLLLPWPNPVATGPVQLWSGWYSLIIATPAPSARRSSLMSVPYGWFGFITLPMPYKRNRILIAPITTISIMENNALRRS